MPARRWSGSRACSAVVKQQLGATNTLSRKEDVSECFQVVYTRKTPLPEPEGVAIRPLGEEYAETVHSLYPLIEKEERVREILRDGTVYGAFLPVEGGEALAAELGVSRQAVAKWEAGGSLR